MFDSPSWGHLRVVFRRIGRFQTTSDRFGSIINNFQFFLQCHFHYYLSWLSSDLTASLGHRPSPFSLNSTPETTGPHNSPSKSCFSTPQEERRILISSSYSPYDLVSLSRVPRTPFYLPKARLWCFSAQSTPTFNFGNFLVPHVQRQDGNPTVEEFPWYPSGKSPTCNFRATINSFSNQSFFTFNSYKILELIHWTCLSFSLTPSCVYKYKNSVRWPPFQTCKFPWTHLSFYFNLRNFL